ncbi:MAG: family 16 glycosylhydrolase [Novosphingobium sp.]
MTGRRAMLLVPLLAPLLLGARPSAPAPASGYELVWADEFDRPGLPDPAKWRHETERNRDGWYNEEAQYYSPADGANAWVHRGVLTIEAHDGPPGAEGARPADWGGQRYSAARLTTGPMAGWTYGLVEVRAKFSCGRGSWPAIWMLPVDPAHEWPDDGEIDIMEHVGFDPGVIHQSIHTRAYNHIDKTQKTAVFPVAGACGGFHRYQLEWTPDRIRMGADGRWRFAFRREGSDRARWPFDRPFRVILNLAVGGFWGGAKGIDPQAFPMRMEVDYVRVWQRRGDPR